jgi:hypothetical protein
MESTETTISANDMMARDEPADAIAAYRRSDRTRSLWSRYG